MRCTTRAARAARRGAAADRVAADIARIAIEQQRAYQALQAQRGARSQAMLRAIPDWMFLTTVDGVFLDYHVKDLSQAAHRAGGIPRQDIKDVLPPPVADGWPRRSRAPAPPDEPEKIEYTLALEGAERFYEACVVRCDGDKILSIVRDITDRKQAELEADAQRRRAGSSQPSRDAGRAVRRARARAEPAAHRRAQQRAGGAALLLDREPLDVGGVRGALDDIIGTTNGPAR